MRKGPRTFQFLVGAKGLTRFGGLSLLHQFCNSLGLRRFLQTYVPWPRYLHRSYHPVDLFLAHLFAIVAGLGRIENTQSLLHNGLIPPILGLPDFPHRDTLRTFLWRFDSQTLRSLEAVHDRFRTELFQRLGLRYDAIVDADTTALITYGSQEGVALGYIPKRRHRQGSYAPILASEGHSGLSLGAQLRAGNVHAATGSWPFLAAQLDKLPRTVAASRTRVRLDGAFYDQEIVQPLDGKRVGYCIVAHMTQPLKDRMVAASYHEFREGWEAAEFPYTPFHWQQTHRFVAVRRPVTHEPLERQQQLFTFKRYTYHRALVTNLALTSEAVYRCYGNRAFQELLLREFKHAYHLAAIPTRSFWANATYLELILWAYDIVLAFQRLCLPPEVQHWNVGTLRRELWWLPAEWVRRGNRNYLRIPAKYPHPDLLGRIQRAASRVKPLL
ncbi:MAG: IS1380 family transposase [Elusimicrobia bacterium]|nr:IS1380 family transposase [Elusimicrobiota bacterium]